jgi:hypothetical protein
MFSTHTLLGSRLHRLFIPPLKRSFWRGVLAGKLVQWIGAVAVALFWVICRRLWSLVQGPPFQPTHGPIDPNTSEWLLMQALGFAVSMASGFAAARWSKPRSWTALVALVLLAIIMSFIFPPPETASMVRKAVWLSFPPLGLICGGLIYRPNEART